MHIHLYWISFVRSFSLIKIIFFRSHLYSACQTPTSVIATQSNERWNLCPLFPLSIALWWFVCGGKKYFLLRTRFHATLYPIAALKSSNSVGSFTPCCCHCECRHLDTSANYSARNKDCAIEESLCVIVICACWDDFIYFFTPPPPNPSYFSPGPLGRPHW